MSENRNGGIASAVPLNARIFLRNLFRDPSDTSSLIRAEDFSDEEIKEMQRRIRFHENRNKLEEKRLRDAYEHHQEVFAPTPDDPVPLRSAENAAAEYREKLASFNKDRNKTSVEPDWNAPGYGAGPSIPTAVGQSFLSPSYRLNTTLGHFNAFKNDDGTVTIRDPYDWLYQEGDAVMDEIKENPFRFLGDAVKSIFQPEAAGNILMRTLARDKRGFSEFTIPYE
jgi:hypothetical protein